jgi:hypothetical protein
MSNAGGITIPDFRLYYRTIVTRAAWYWHEIRHTKWDRIEDPEIKPLLQLSLTKHPKNKCWRKGSFSNK